MDTKRTVAASAILLVLLALVAGMIYFFSPGLIASFGSQHSYTFATSSKSDLINIGKGLTVNGQRVYLENLQASTTGEGNTKLQDPNAPIARFHVGDRSKPVYRSDSKVRIGNWQVRVQDLKACYQDRIGFGYESTCFSHIQNIIYSIKLNVSKDAITANTSEIVLEDVRPGVKLLTANITVQNNFGPIQADRVTATVFGKDVTLDSGVIEDGQHTYRVTVQNNYYDPSKFLHRKTVNEQLQLSFQNPRLPQNQVSGKPDIDGNLRTYESFEPGGSTPSIQDLREGDERYSAVDSPCNIQFLQDNGFGTRDCHGYSGGESQPMSTQNHRFPLTAMKSRTVAFNATVAYCGENASYRDGRCQIDDGLHLRSDVCPLLQRHQIITETFSGNQVLDVSDLNPEPQFFCTKHPVLMTDAEGQQTGFTTEPYRKLINKGEVEIPEGQTYTLYWTVNVNEVNTSIVCKQGSFNTSTGNCQRTPGVTHRCSQGVYDPQVGSCVVTPETTYICSQGYYDKGLGKCVYEPPVKKQCNRGYFDESRGVCLAEGTVKTGCPKNATKENGVCKIEPRVVKMTPMEQFRLGLERVVFQNPVKTGVGTLGLALLLSSGVYFYRKRQ